MVRRFPSLRLAPALAVVALLLSGCSLWDDLFGSNSEPPLPGTRVAVLQGNTGLTADPAVADRPVILPEPYVNESWEQEGGSPAHAMYHLELGTSPRPVWRASVGKGNSDDAMILSQPIVVGDSVYTMDARSRVTRYRQSDGGRVWEVDLTPGDDDDDDDGYFGGGVAYADGRLFVSTGFGKVFALDSSSGQTVWEQTVSAPMRSAPTVSGGRVFVVTFDNQAFALAASDGRRLWSHTGIQEATALLGTASPAVAGGTVIIPYTSGEIYALQVENGRQIWSDSLAAVRRTDPLSDIAQIRGLPVIDRGMLYVVSHAGRTVAYDLRRGARIWERDVGGTQTPWAAGEFIFMLTKDSELLCLTRDGGVIRWVTALPQFDDPEDRDDPINWHGPVLAGDRLIVAGSNGDAYSISPYTGKILGHVSLPDGAAVEPVVAKSTLYFISIDADIEAMR